MKAPTPVKLEIILEIYKNVLTSFYRLDALLKDYFYGDFFLGEAERSALLDSLASASALKILFEDYIEQANTAEVETLYIPYQEFKGVLNMARSVEASTKISFGGVGIWEN